jgi:hypothetical protein
MTKLLLTLLYLVQFHLYGQKLNHAYIQDNRFIYLSPEDGDRWGRIKNFELNKKTLPWETPYLVESTTLLPPIWVYDKKRVLTITKDGSRADTKFRLSEIKYLFKDSVQQRIDEDRLSDSLKQLYPDNWLIHLTREISVPMFPRTLFKISPINDWWTVQYEHSFLNNITFLQRYVPTFANNRMNDLDFWYQAEQNTYFYYQRTQASLFLWRYTGSEKKDTAFADWRLDKHFSTDSTFAVPTLLELDSVRFLGRWGSVLLPDTLHFQPCTIADTAFFRGHNKAIMQGGQHWLINTAHGAIYYLARDGVKKVAQIENFQNYPAAVLNQKLFIEDRDQGELLFFSKIIHLDPKLPLPKYKSLTTATAIRQRMGVLATLPNQKKRK